MESPRSIVPTTQLGNVICKSILKVIRSSPAVKRFRYFSFRTDEYFNEELHKRNRAERVSAKITFQKVPFLKLEMVPTKGFNYFFEKTKQRDKLKILSSCVTILIRIKMGETMGLNRFARTTRREFF